MDNVTFDFSAPTRTRLGECERKAPTEVAQSAEQNKRRGHEVDFSSELNSLPNTTIVPRHHENNDSGWIMTSTKTDEAIVVETGSSEAIYSVAFCPDGIHFLTGSEDGIRQWRLADGQEVPEQRMQMDCCCAISVSRNNKYLICGTRRGAGVWNVETREKAIEVEGTDFVGAVDISPDLTRFATGTGNRSNIANIWDIATGERLVGPLQHDYCVIGAKFSPGSERIATAAETKSIHIFDSHSGEQIISIEASLPEWSAVSPLAWSNDALQIFAPSSAQIINSFDTSTGQRLLTESQTRDSEVVSIALAASGKFLASFANDYIFFCDTSTLVQVGPALRDRQRTRSIELSPDCSYLVTGGFDGNITIRNLCNILPASYGPFKTPKKQSSSFAESESIEDEADDLLDTELPSSTPAPLFDYDEPPSPETEPREVEVAPSDVPHAIPLSDPLAPPTMELTDAPTPSKGISTWFQTRFKKTNGIPTSRTPDRRFRPSTYIGGQRVRRTVAKPVNWHKGRNIATGSNGASKDKDASASGQASASAKETDAVPQGNGTSRSSAKAEVHIMEEAGEATVSIAVRFKLPVWMLCFKCSSVSD